MPQASLAATNSGGPAASARTPVANPAAPSQTNVATVRSTTAPPTLNLTQPGQAAARQDSVLPLLQNLAALSARATALPAPVAEAATRLLALRMPLDRGAPGADTLRQAVTRAGVLSAPAGAGATPNVKSALLQLRAGLLTMLGDGEIAAVAPVARRAAPPMRNALPRGLKGDAPSLPDTATPRDAARTLLHQTDSALSRLKLTQLASQPADARAGAPVMPDLTVEIPMMLGHELALAQLQIQRDGKSKAKPGERGWRLRFAVNFSMVGEVGAQVSLLAQATSVVLWAAEDATAAALEDMLPELGAALAARGLEVGSVRLRRGAPTDPVPASGQLMDTVG